MRLHTACRVASRDAGDIAVDRCWRGVRAARAGRRGRLIGLVSVAVLVLGGCSGPPVTRNGPAQMSSVSRTWPVPLDSVRSAVLSQFQRASGPRPAPFTPMSVVELKTRSPTWAEGYVDPGGFLQPYRSLSAADRVPDLLIQDLGDNYWMSEYTSAAGPVKFHCGFILHFAPEGEATRVEVYEMTPTVWPGEIWAMAAHGIGPARIHDLRFVEPTVTDRQHMLAWIGTVLR